MNTILSAITLIPFIGGIAMFIWILIKIVHNYKLTVMVIMWIIIYSIIVIGGLVYNAIVGAKNKLFDSNFFDSN